METRTLLYDAGIIMAVDLDVKSQWLPSVSGRNIQCVNATRLVTRSGSLHSYVISYNIRVIYRELKVIVGVSKIGNLLHFENF